MFTRGGLPTDAIPLKSSNMVGRGGIPSLALVLLLAMKKISPADYRHGRRLRFSVRRKKTKTDRASLSYKLSKPVDLGANDLMFSRRFIRLSTGLYIISIPDVALPHEIVAASHHRSAKRRGKPNQEAR